MPIQLSTKLQQEWNFARNGIISIYLKPKSRKKFWWICKFGHEWRTHVYVRSNGGGCAVCARKIYWRGVTDLATVLPEWAELWDYESNYPKTPDQIRSTSKKRYTYKCPEGHKWQATPNTTKTRPLCAFCREDKYAKVLVGVNDLVTFCKANNLEHILNEWDSEKNKRPMKSYIYRNALLVAWVCQNNPNHQWKETIRNRVVVGYGCPFCSGQRLEVGVNDLESQVPELSSLWHPMRNLPLTPSQITKASSVEIWWECSRGHEWLKNPNVQRTRDGCPECTPWGTSKRERAIFDYLELIGYAVSRKVLHIAWSDKSKIRPDIIVNGKVIIEYDGHFYHSRTVEEDKTKTNALIGANFQVVRIRDTKFLPTLFTHKRGYYEVAMDEAKGTLESITTPLIQLLERLLPRFE